MRMDPRGQMASVEEGESSVKTMRAVVVTKAGSLSTSMVASSCSLPPAP